MLAKRMHGAQSLPPRPDITANTGSLAIKPESCASQVSGGPFKSQTCSCQRRFTMYIVLLYMVFSEVCILGKVRRTRVFFSAKYCCITSIMPCRFTGSASGVMIVAKCSTVSVTPGTRIGSSPLRYAISAVMSASFKVYRGMR